jgi:colanic acid biosynthesis glycosyl transferase WcaI
VIASSPSPFAALAGYVIGALRFRPFVLEVRDLWPEDLLQEGLMSPGLAAFAMEKMMMFLYRRAAAVIAVTQGIQEGVLKRGIAAEKVHLCANSIDPHLYESGPLPEEAKRALALEGKFVVLYAGNHGISNALGSILETARLLMNRADIHFLMVGDGEEKRNLVLQAEQNGLSNIIFMPPQPKGKMPLFYAAADCSVVPLKNVPIYQGALPNKLLDSMASGTAVLVATGEEANSIIEASQGGLCVPPEDPGALAEAIIQLYVNREMTERMAQQGRRYVLAHYSHRTAAEKLEEVFGNVVERPSY